MFMLYFESTIVQDGRVLAHGVSTIMVLGGAK